MKLCAEIGSNHNGSLERALELVKTAADCGFTAVKTQAWRVEELFSPEALAARPNLLDRRRFEVPLAWHIQLEEAARKRDLYYGVTPCSILALEECLPYADWLKVSSYSILDRALLKAAGAAGKPIVLSTGMATLEEVRDAALWLRDPTFLHCVSSYPAPPYEANLRAIRTLRETFGRQVGWSDHTCSPLVVGRALNAYGADMLEVHWDLDDRLGAETAHSWTPHTWKDFQVSPKSADLSSYYACDGSGKKAPTISESIERDWRADPSDGLRPLKHVRATLGVEAKHA